MASPVSRSLSLENFLQSVKTDLLNPVNNRKVSDNLSKGEREVLKSLQQLDRQTIRIQDKGSKFVVLGTEEYENKIRNQLNNSLHYRQLTSDPSLKNLQVITEWCNKWLEKGEINDNIKAWIIKGKVKPGKAFGTVKTHQEGNPIRLITSCCGTAIENLSAFSEYYLRPLAQELPSFIKDTTHLLQKIKELNRKGPFPSGTLLVSWDVFSMFPNIDNNLGTLAITKALNSRTIKNPSTDALSRL